MSETWFFRCEQRGQKEIAIRRMKNGSVLLVPTSHIHIKYLNPERAKFIAIWNVVTLLSLEFDADFTLKT
jgi:hypothetical protein